MKQSLLKWRVREPIGFPINISLNLFGDFSLLMVVFYYIFNLNQIQWTTYDDLWPKHTYKALADLNWSSEIYYV